MFRRTTLLERLLLIAAGLLLVYPKTAADIIGIGLVALVVLLQALKKRVAPA